MHNIFTMNAPFKQSSSSEEGKELTDMQENRDEDDLYEFQQTTNQLDIFRQSIDGYLNKKKSVPIGKERYKKSAMIEKNTNRMKNSDKNGINQSSEDENQTDIRIQEGYNCGKDQLLNERMVEKQLIWSNQQRGKPRGRPRSRPEGTFQPIRRRPFLRRRGRGRFRVLKSNISWDYNDEITQVTLQGNQNVNPDEQQKIRKLVENNRTIPMSRIALQLNFSLNKVLSYFKSKQFTSKTNIIQDIVRQNARQTPTQIQQQILTRFEIRIPCKEIVEILAKDLRYSYICGKPARIQPIYQKSDSIEVLNMRFMFCDYLRRAKYNLKDIYIVGLRIFSFEIKTNYIWLHDLYKGNILQDYGYLTYKNNEVMLLVTFSCDGFVHYQLFYDKLTEEKFIEHIEQGYLKKNKSNSIVVISNSIPKELFTERAVERKLNLEKGSLRSPDYYLKKKAECMRNLATNLNIKYINAPPYAHKLDPLQGLFMKLDHSINISQLEDLFLKNIVNVQLLKHQLQSQLKQITNKDFQQFFAPLQAFLSIPKLEPQLFLEKHWEDILFDSFDKGKIEGQKNS